MKISIQILIFQKFEKFDFSKFQNFKIFKNFEDFFENVFRFFVGNFYISKKYFRIILLLLCRSQIFPGIQKSYLENHPMSLCRCITKLLKNERLQHLEMLFSWGLPANGPLTVSQRYALKGAFYCTVTRWLNAWKQLNVYETALRVWWPDPVTMMYQVGKLKNV